MGLRNTDITNAHGLVIHGFRPFIYSILCAFGAILKDFGEQARLVVSVHPRVTRSVQKSFKIAPKALLNPNVIGIRIRE